MHSFKFEQPLQLSKTAPVCDLLHDFIQMKSEFNTKAWSKAPGCHILTAGAFMSSTVFLK